MDTSTGEIKKLEDFKFERGEFIVKEQLKSGRLVILGKNPDEDCSICCGKGYLPQNLFQRIFRFRKVLCNCVK